MTNDRHFSSRLGCLMQVLGSVGSSLLGGVAGFMIGIEKQRGTDPILPVFPIFGLIVGLIVGPVLFTVVRLCVTEFWKGVKEQKEEKP